MNPNTYLLKTADVDLFENLNPNGSGEIEPVSSFADAMYNLGKNGVTKLEKVIDLSELKAIKHHARQKMYYGKKTDTVIVGKDGLKHVVFVKGRQDTWPINLQLTIPTILTDVLTACMQADYKKSSTGVLTLDAKTDHTGKWHRDTMPLFNVGDAKTNDEFTLKLPNFYYTVFIPLSSCKKENGATEILLGSHLGTNGALAVAECEPGDVICMNGKTIHRAASNMTNENRDLLYIIYCAKWYDEEKF